MPKRAQPTDSDSERYSASSHARSDQDDEKQPSYSDEFSQDSPRMSMHKSSPIYRQTFSNFKALQNHSSQATVLPGYHGEQRFSVPRIHSRLVQVRNCRPTLLKKSDIFRWTTKCNVKCPPIKVTLPTDGMTRTVDLEGTCPMRGEIVIPLDPAETLRSKHVSKLYTDLTKREVLPGGDGGLIFTPDPEAKLISDAATFSLRDQPIPCVVTADGHIHTIAGHLELIIPKKDFREAFLAVIYQSQGSTVAEIIRRFRVAHARELCSDWTLAHPAALDDFVKLHQLASQISKSKQAVFNNEEDLSDRGDRGSQEVLIELESNFLITTRDLSEQSWEESLINVAVDKDWPGNGKTAVCFFRREYSSDNHPLAIAFVSGLTSESVLDALALFANMLNQKGGDYWGEKQRNLVPKLKYFHILGFELSDEQLDAVFPGMGVTQVISPLYAATEARRLLADFAAPASAVDHFCGSIVPMLASSATRDMFIGSWNMFVESNILPYTSFPFQFRFFDAFREKYIVDKYFSRWYYGALLEVFTVADGVYLDAPGSVADSPFKYLHDFHSIPRGLDDQCLRRFVKQQMAMGGIFCRYPPVSRSISELPLQIIAHEAATRTTCYDSNGLPVTTLKKLPAAFLSSDQSLSFHELSSSVAASLSPGDPQFSLRAFLTVCQHFNLVITVPGKPNSRLICFCLDWGRAGKCRHTEWFTAYWWMLSGECDTKFLRVGQRLLGRRDDWISLLAGYRGIAVKPKPFELSISFEMIRDSSLNGIRDCSKLPLSRRGLSTGLLSALGDIGLATGGICTQATPLDDGKNLAIERASYHSTELKGNIRYELGESVLGADGPSSLNKNEVSLHAATKTLLCTR